MPNEYTEEVVSAPIETTTDLGTPKSLELQEGLRYNLHNGRATGVLKKYTDTSGVHFRDMLDSARYTPDGVRIGYASEFEGNVKLDSAIAESYPFEVMAGGVYRRRDGSLTGYLSERSSLDYPLIDQSSGITFTREGKHSPYVEGDLDLVEAVYLPFLRDGWYGRRRDGVLTGRITVIQDVGNPNTYMFHDPQRQDTYAPCGTCHIGCVRDSDIVELVDKWDNLVFEPTAPIEGFPLRGGDVVELSDAAGEWLVSEYNGVLAVRGMNVDPESGLVGVSSGTWPRRVVRITRRVEHYELNGSILGALVFKGFSSGYKWLGLGKSVNCGYIAPWAYCRPDEVGVVKDSGQRMDGFGGDYIIGLPVSCDLDPTSIEGLRHNASINALVKYWKHRVHIQSKVDEFTDCGLPIADCAHNAERLIHKEFPRITCDDNTIVHVTYDTASTAMVLSKENGYFKCKPMTWAKVFTALNKEKGIDTTDEMRRLFIERFDEAVKTSAVTIEWSTVSETYCTPMYGWNNEDDSVTGSCMEKFCDDDGNGYAVFDVYKRLERLGKLKMIRICIEDNYVGRAICWWPNHTSGWVMDRVYCKQERGEIPKTVITALAKFAGENQIVGRTDKCRVSALSWHSMKDIDADGLTGYAYYPYFDTYAGISPDGVHMDSSDCTVVCDSPDGDPTQAEMHEARGRGGYYRESDLRWSEYYNEYVHEEDAVDDYQDNVLHTDDAVELGFDSGVYAHTDDVIQVRLPNSRGRMETVYALEA